MSLLHFVIVVDGNDDDRHFYEHFNQVHIAMALFS